MAIVGCGSDDDESSDGAGTKILFESDRDGLNDLYMVTPTGAELTNVTNTSAEHEYAPSWSPDGSEFVFVSDPRTPIDSTYGWDMKLIVADELGTNFEVLDQNAPMFRPVWSPSGDRIIYQRGAPSRPLYEVRRAEDGTWGDGEQVCAATTESNNIRSRYQFYGDDHIIFDGMVPLSIYRLDLVSCELDELEVGEGDFQYAPDATSEGRIVFVRADGADQSLYVKDSFDTGSAALLDESDPFPDMPLWSHSGQRVFYWSNSSAAGPGPVEIYDMQTGNPGVMASTTAVAGQESGTYLEDHDLQRWSPDDRHVVFVGAVEGTTSTIGDEVYVLDVDADEIVNVSNAPQARDTSPVWQPGVPGTPPRADLIVADEGVSVAAGGDEVEVTFRIRNVGDATAGPSLAYVNAIDPTIPEPGDRNQIRDQQSFEVSELDPDRESQEFVATLSMQTYEAEGVQYFDVLADAKDVVVESDEDNNTARVAGPT